MPGAATVKRVAAFFTMPLFLGHFSPLIRGDGVPILDPNCVGCLRQLSALFSFGDQFRGLGHAGTTNNCGICSS
jgi:hypothetical protein